MPANLENSAVATGLEKVCLHSNPKERQCQRILKNAGGNAKRYVKKRKCIPIPKKGNAKECSNYCTIALISHASKEMLKILQARIQHYMNQELPDVQTEFRKGRGTRDQIANIHWIIAREFQKYLLLLHLLH